MRIILSTIAVAAAVLLGAVLVRAQRPLEIYYIDVEGGGELGCRAQRHEPAPTRDGKLGGAFAAFQDCWSRTARRINFQVPTLGRWSAIPCS